MVETIKAKWSENTGNRKALNEDVISNGIVENSLVNSDELNAVVARQDEMLDDLQRGNAWNIGKEYKIGDMIFLNVNYKRASDVLGKNFKVYLVSLKDNNTQEPFQNNNAMAISFSKNYDYAVTQFIIQIDNDETPLKNFVNSEFWQIIDATANDLNNAVRLNVSNESKLGTLGSDSSIITFNKDLNINSDIITNANFNINKNLNANGMTTNNDMKFNNAFCNKPLNSARGNEIVNAKWANEHTNGQSFIYDYINNIDTLPSPLYSYVDKKGSVDYQYGVFYHDENTIAMNEIPLTKSLPNFSPDLYLKLYPASFVRNYLSSSETLIQTAIFFPQDYILDYFSYLKYSIIYKMTYMYPTYIRFLYIPRLYIMKFCFKQMIKNNVKGTTEHTPIYYYYSEYYKKEDEYQNNWISVDFSNDFEISVAEYLGEQNSLYNICGSNLLAYGYESASGSKLYSSENMPNFLNVIKDNKITKMSDTIIKWEKDKRRLSFSSKSPLASAKINYFYLIYYALYLK